MDNNNVENLAKGDIVQFHDFVLEGFRDGNGLCVGQVCNPMPPKFIKSSAIAYVMHVRNNERKRVIVLVDNIIRMNHPDNINTFAISVLAS